MRTWIFVLAVLATFQAIVQVASTDYSAAKMLLDTKSTPSHRSSSKEQQKQPRHRRSWSSPTLSFAAIVAAPISTSSVDQPGVGVSSASASEFSLTNLNNIVLNSDNVRHPMHTPRKQDSAHQLQQLLVPTNSPITSPEESSVVVSASSANSLVNKRNSNNNHSGNNISNLVINSNQIASAASSTSAEAAVISSQRRHRSRPGKGLRGRRQRSQGRRQKQQLPRVLGHSVLENSVNHQKEQQQQVRVNNSNELNVEDVEDDDEVEGDMEDQEVEEKVRVKPDPETLVTIEKNLLSLFGFKKRPKIDRSKVVIPDAMRRMYEETTGLELDLSDDLPKPAIHGAHYTANTVRSFTHEESKIDHRFVHHHRFRLHFNTSNIPHDEILKAAELVLSRDAVPDADRVRHRVQVYDIVRPGVKGKREPSFLLIDTKVVKVNSSENLVLDVSPAMERWQREPKHNHGLLVHVSTVGRRGPKKVTTTTTTTTTTSSPEPMEINGVELNGPIHHHVRLRRSLRDTEDAWGQKQPLLFAYTDDKRHRSSRAAAKDGHHHGGNRMRNRAKKRPRNGICQRYALWVDFEDVGWNDWIVAPRGYDAFYCKGECRIPMADHLNATNHAVVQTLVNSISPKTAPRACCVPTQLTTTSLLYLDDQNKLVLKKYQDMAVVGCGCR